MNEIVLFKPFQKIKVTYLKSIMRYILLSYQILFINIVCVLGFSYPLYNMVCSQIIISYFYLLLIQALRNHQIGMSQPINKTVIQQGSLIINPNTTINKPSQRQPQRQRPRQSYPEDHTNSLKQSVLDSFMHQQYSHINDEPLIKVFFFQFFGMMLFACLAFSTVVPLWADIYIGVGILVGVVVAGPVSGANLNPGVTLCNYIRKENKLKLKLVPVYIVAQFLGAFMAILYSQLIDDLKVGPLMPYQQNWKGILRLMFSQAIGQFVLIFFILQISNPNTTFIDNQLSGYLFIVFFVHAARKFSPSSHECINSAIAISLALVSLVETGNAKGLLYSLLYVAGHLIGVFLAIFFYEKMFQPNVQHCRKIRRELQQKNLQSLLQNTTIADMYQD